jgi:diketogulonate reductase-like aldo/keto reductase
MLALEYLDLTVLVLLLVLLLLLLQVALNWIICKGAVPIPGAKNKKQVDEIAGAVGWRLEEGEIAELERAADKIVTPLGAPFENW